MEIHQIAVEQMGLDALIDRHRGAARHVRLGRGGAGGQQAKKGDQAQQGYSAAIAGRSRVASARDSSAISVLARAIGLVR